MQYIYFIKENPIEAYGKKKVKIYISVSCNNICKDIFSMINAFSFHYGTNNIRSRMKVKYNMQSQDGAILTVS